MSIASEISDLATNLASAKNAITAKGGTVGDTGLAGLATEIASIPAGSTDNWGFVTYVDANNIEHTVEIQNEEELLLLGNPSNVSITIGGETFNLRDVTKVTLGVYAGYAPDYFLCSCDKLTEITGVNNLIIVGEYFLADCTNLDCELSFDKLLICGGYFLNGCTKLNHQVTFSELHKIGTYFMSQCSSYTLTLTFPITLTDMSSATYFLYRCNNLTGVVCNCSTPPVGNRSISTNSSSAPMYVNGVILTGTYANEWKTALPDNDSSPYRKLIVGA